MDNQRNLLLAVALSGLLIIGWDFAMRTFYPEAAITSPTEQVEPAAQASAGDAPGTATVAADLPEGTDAPAPTVDLSEALADPNRVVIDTPRLAGSINLVGAQVDDIVLKDYRQSVEKDSGPVRLFAPARTDDQYFAQFGYAVGGVRMADDAVWEASGDKLTPSTPVTLTRTDDAGITYSIALSIDEDYMISGTQTAQNTTEAAAIIQPLVYIQRNRNNASPDEFIVHSGPIGVFDGTLNDDASYTCESSFWFSSCEGLVEQKRISPAGAVSWLGFTDRYWLSAIIPGEGETADAGFRSQGDDVFRSGVVYEAQTVPAGGSLTQSTRLFAGAKKAVVLDEYEDSGITYFGKAISWGWFEFIEKPFLWLLRTLNGLVGNFGVAIILLTVIVRGLMFPIAQKQFSSMAGMKAVQPKMKAIQERYKDDKQQQQQEIMKLYKEEGVNPLAGCLPILIQIPIFFALYKVLMLAIEMRHEPFLYISDLSAPDPATILNLFGYLPFEVPGFLGIGVLAVLLGLTMWLTFKLNPSAMDPMQQQIFNLMPWILMFVMAPFAAGLLIYWVTSNILTVAQQSYLYSKHPALKAQAKKDKEEMAKKKAAEKEAKGKA